jgi:hypothetical protein
MARHSENALAVARYLTAHPRVSWVNYPGLLEGSAHDRLKNRKKLQIFWQCPVSKTFLSKFHKYATSLIRRTSRDVHPRRSNSSHRACTWNGNRNTECE